MTMFEGPTGAICPSCADYVHGDCALWGQAEVCTCPCVKRCAARPAGKRSQHRSCSLPMGHEGHHEERVQFVTDSVWQECLCGYMGSPGHHCNMTMASLKVTVELDGQSVVIQTDPTAEPIEAEWQIMDGLRKLHDGSHFTVRKRP